MVEKPFVNALDAGTQSCVSGDGVQYTGYISRMLPVVGAETLCVGYGPRGGDDVCVGCGTRILDRYFLLVADQPWHVTCLRCRDCNLQLDTELTCFSRDGSIFCKEDYYKRYSVRRCSRCHQGVAANELIMRARDLIFHLSCFTCAACMKPLATGDHYGIHDNLVYCRADYEVLFHGEQYLSLSPSPAGPAGLGLPFYTGVGSVQKGRPRKRKNMLPEGDACLTPLGMMTNEHGDLIAHDYGSGSSSRQKRVRTSFKHHQLRTMKSYFALNHNPDAKDLKQLAQKTQLSKRVLQVWFQNARAKYRRGSGKLDQDKQDDGDKSNTKSSSEDSEQLLDLSNRRSPALSDISSSQSLPDSIDVPECAIEHGNSSDSLSELFTDSGGRATSDK